MAKRVNLTDEQRAVMATDYEKGKGMGAIAKEFGCSIPTVRRNLVSQGTEIRKKGRPRKDGTLTATVPNPAPVVDVLEERAFADGGVGPGQAEIDETEVAPSEFSFPTKL